MAELRIDEYTEVVSDIENPSPDVVRQVVVHRWEREFTATVRRRLWIAHPILGRKYRTEVVVSGAPGSYARVDALPDPVTDADVAQAIGSCLRGPGAVTGRAVEARCG